MTRALVLALVVVALACEDDNSGPTAVVQGPPGGEIGSPVLLDASGSTDPEGDGLAFAWRVVSAPVDLALREPNRALLSFTPPDRGTYVLAVEVSDGAATDTAEHTVQVACATPREIVGFAPDAATWTEINPPVDCPDYRVVSDVVVPVGQVLTIEPGVIVDVDAGWLIGTAGGQLSARGTETAPILLRGPSGRGTWEGLVLDRSPNAELAWVRVENGGQGDRAWTPGGVVTLRNTTLSLENVTVSGSGGFGLVLHPDSNLSGFSANTLTGGVLGAARVAADQLRNLDAERTLTGNDRDVLEVLGASVTVASTIRDLGVPLVVGDEAVGELAIRAEVSVREGVRFAFRPGTGLRVIGARLSVAGSSAAPVAFSGAEGDGTWRGLFFDAGSEVELRSATLRGAAGTPVWADPVQTSSAAASVAVLGGRPRTRVALTDVRIEASSGLALWVADIPEVELNCTGLGADGEIVPSCPFRRP